MILKIFILTIMSTTVFADINNGIITNNSIIRASDINTKLEEIRTAVQNKELNPPNFNNILIGQEVTKNSILNELSKITDVIPLNTELILSNEILSEELNSLFNSILIEIENFEIQTEYHHIAFFDSSNPSTNIQNIKTTTYIGASSPQQTIANVLISENEILGDGLPTVELYNPPNFKLDPDNLVVDYGNPLFSFTNHESFMYSLQTIIDNFIGNIFSSPHGFEAPLKIYKIKVAANTNPSGNDNPFGMIPFKNEVYFHSTNSSGYTKLFKIDNEGEVLQVSNTNPTSSDNPFNFVEFNNHLYFRSQNHVNFTKLFRVEDNTIRQISNLRGSNSDSISNITIFNNELYFSGNNNSGHNKLFKYTENGVLHQVSNIRNNNNDNPQYLFIHDNYLYFTAQNSNNMNKLFRLNLNNQIENLPETNEFSPDIPAPLEVKNNYLYYMSRNSEDLYKLYRANSSGEVELISNINQSEHDIFFLSGNLTINFNNEIYFIGTLPEGTSLFKINENTNQVQRLFNFFNPSQNDDIQHLLSFNNNLYFTGKNSSGNTKLFKYNVLTSELKQISNTNPSGNDTQASFSYIIFDEELFFIGVNSNNHSKLFKMDKNDKILQVSNIFPNNHDNPSHLTVINNRLYFRGGLLELGGNKLYSLELIP